MNAHAVNSGPILKENKQINKNQNLREESFYVFYYPENTKPKL
jgi:hypothetical protein